MFKLDRLFCEPLSKKNESFVLLGILLLAFIVRLNRYGDDLWADEAFNWFVSKDGPFQAIERIKRDFFPPLYSLLLSGWLKVFPATEFWIRLPSVIAGCLSVYWVYRLALHEQKPSWALITLFLLSLVPNHVVWSQIARPFSYSSLFVVIAIYLGFRIHLQTLRWDSASFAQNKALFVGLWAALTAAVYTHNGAIVFSVVLYLILVVPVVYQYGRQSFERVKLLTLPFLATLVCWLPWAPNLYAQMEYSAQLPYHYPGVGMILPDIIAFIQIPRLWVAPIFENSITWPLFFLGVWALFKKRNDWSRYLLAVGFVYPLCLIILYPVEPVTGRVFQRSFWLSLVWFVFIAEALIWIWTKAFQYKWEKLSVRLLFLSGLSGLILLLLLANVNEYRVKWNNWSRFARDIVAESSEHDVFVPIPAINYAALNYYTKDAIPQNRIYIPRHLMQWRADNISELLGHLNAVYPEENVDHVWIFSIGDPRLILPYVKDVHIDAVAPNVSANPLAVKVALD